MKVIMTMYNGVIQDVLADDEVEVIVLEYDTEGYSFSRPNHTLYGEDVFVHYIDADKNLEEVENISRDLNQLE